MKKIQLLFLTLVSGLALMSCTDLTEHPYTQLSGDVYYTDEASVKAVIAHIYSQEMGDMAEGFYYLSEIAADQISWVSFNNRSYCWSSGAKYELSTHNWTSTSTIVKNAWQNAWKTVGMCNALVEDISNISAASLGITEAKKQAYIDEIRTFRIYCYYLIYETWGGAIPLTTSTDTSILPYSASYGTSFEEGCKLIWDWFVKELDESCPNLPKTGDVNRCNQAMNRMMKMRLLLNANIFIGEDHFAECATLAQEILDGKYGTYALADRWQDIYAADNDKCKEIIFAFAWDHLHKNASNYRSVQFAPYNYQNYFDCKSMNTGWCAIKLTPSFDNSGSFYDDVINVVVTQTGVDKKGNPTYSTTYEFKYNEDGSIKTHYDKSLAKCFLDAPYNDKLGATHERFNPKDVRNQLPYNDAEGNFGGQFMEGLVFQHYNQGPDPFMSEQDCSNLPLVGVDQVGTFRSVDKNPTYTPLATIMDPRWGEYTSGIRYFKYPFYPTEYGDGYGLVEADQVEFRLSEVYYTLAECKMRAGDSQGAKDLVNQVRKRYFSAEDWATAKDELPRGFTAFDMDWMLSEWGVEFLEEGHRRRTDLRRFDKFTQGQWWFFGRYENLPAKRDRKYEWYPIPQTALTVNPGLVQVPGYEDD